MAEAGASSRLHRGVGHLGTQSRGFVISKLALATVASAAHVAFFWIIDIPYWLPMGIFAGFVSQFIPTIGTYIGIIVPAFFAAFNDPWDVLWIVIFATIYQQIENYIFTPRISTATMAINSGVALASVFIGAALFGPIGAIIGIPVVAIVIAVVEPTGAGTNLILRCTTASNPRRRNCSGPSASVSFTCRSGIPRARIVRSQASTPRRYLEVVTPSHQ